MISPTEELRETRELVRTLCRAVRNYESISRGTGFAPVAEAARVRVARALRRCLDDAVRDLGGGSEAEIAHQREVETAALDRFDLEAVEMEASNR